MLLHLPCAAGKFLKIAQKKAPGANPIVGKNFSICNSRSARVPHRYDDRLVSWRPCHVGRSNPTVDKIFFVMFTCSVFLAVGLAAFK